MRSFIEVNFKILSYELVANMYVTSILWEWHAGSLSIALRRDFLGTNVLHAEYAKKVNIMKTWCVTCGKIWRCVLMWKHLGNSLIICNIHVAFCKRVFILLQSYSFVTPSAVYKFYCLLFCACALNMLLTSFFYSYFLITLQSMFAVLWGYLLSDITVIWYSRLWKMVIVCLIRRN